MIYKLSVLLSIFCLSTASKTGMFMPHAYHNTLNHKVPVKNGQEQKASSTKYQLVHIFESRGKHRPPFETKVYVKWLQKGIFTNLIVTKRNNGKTDTLYKIDRDKFYIANNQIDSLNHIISDKNFYGYKFGTFRDDSPSFEWLLVVKADNELHAAKPSSVGWDEDKRMFCIMAVQ